MLPIESVFEHLNCPYGADECKRPYCQYLHARKAFIYSFFVYRFVVARSRRASASPTASAVASNLLADDASASSSTHDYHEGESKPTIIKSTTANYKQLLSAYNAATRESNIYEQVEPIYAQLDEAEYASNEEDAAQYAQVEDTDQFVAPEEYVPAKVAPKPAATKKVSYFLYLD